MKLLLVSDAFQIGYGKASVAIGAPHHGTRPSVKADWGTGPIAQALAERLNCPSVVVSDLRRVVDVNKDPLKLNRYLRRHAIRYQNTLFSGRPGLIIEIHGHTTGHYDIEISTGFELDAASEADADYIEKLTLLRQAIPTSLERRLGKRPSVGIWPLDRDVTKTATDTFTFQKVRRARRLAGLPWYGLHIEFNAALRVGQGNRMGHLKTLSPQVVGALADSLAEAIQQSFEPLPPPGRTIPLHSEMSAEEQVLSKHNYFITRVPEGYISENVVVLNPQALNELGIFEGDSVVIRRHEDELHSQVAVSLLIPADKAGITQRMRNQIGVKPGQLVTLLRLSKNPAQLEPSSAAVTRYAVVVHDLTPGRKERMWISSNDRLRLQLEASKPTQVVGRAGNPASWIGQIEIDDELPARSARLSEGLAAKLSVTVGETLRLI